MKKFEINKTYQTRSICDYECVFNYTVISRTEKTVVVKDNFGKVKRCKIKVSDEGEYIMPDGNYSMAPVLRAKRAA